MRVGKIGCPVEGEEKKSKTGDGGWPGDGCCGRRKEKESCGGLVCGGAARSVLDERESNGRRMREGQAVSSLGVAGLWGKRKRLVFGCGGRLL